MNYALPAMKHFEMSKDSLEAVCLKLICYLSNRESNYLCLASPVVTHIG